MRTIDIAGQRYGRVVVIKRLPSDTGKTKWVCRCDCGNDVVLRTDHLRSGESRSCGCLRVEEGESRATHGMSRSKPYAVWCGMIRRCENPKDTSYARYGGRGISVCDRWKKFENFWQDMSSGYREGLEIDRENNSLGYCKENCRWATDDEQARNKRNNVFYTLNGVTRTESWWAQSLGITHSALSKRFRLGWPLELALTTRRSTRGKKNRWSDQQSEKPSNQQHQGD